MPITGITFFLHIISVVIFSQSSVANTISRESVHVIKIFFESVSTTDCCYPQIHFGALLKSSCGRTRRAYIILVVAYHELSNRPFICLELNIDVLSCVPWCQCRMKHINSIGGRGIFSSRGTVKSIIIQVCLSKDECATTGWCERRKIISWEGVNRLFYLRWNK